MRADDGSGVGETRLNFCAPGELSRDDAAKRRQSPQVNARDCGFGGDVA